MEKRQLLRNNEYYNTQEIQDELYRKSKEGYVFKDLLTAITEPKNIQLAYRNIKKNKGSKTCGVNRKTIKHLESISLEQWVMDIETKFDNYKPNPVRRVEIEKQGGGMRPLGIPTIEDRMVQQCIKQVIEPIAEAKFYKDSYGFRPDRGAENAVARLQQLINISGLHYAVDIDIKGFFDNVDHGKLLKQLWTMGIQDKNLLSILSKILKSEIQGIGIPDKGTPQGGVISPILANIVLNELDWWLDSQWQNMLTVNHNSQGAKIKALKKTNLKELYIVRYADDFKIMCRDHKTAQKIFIAVKKWLEERLKLKINTEKSGVVNLRKRHSNFLGFKIKAVKKKNKRVARSYVADKAIKRIIDKYKSSIADIVKNPIKDKVDRLNSKILGWHNYYKIATMVNINFGKINFLVRTSFYNRTRSIRSDTRAETDTYNRLYGKYNYRKYSICQTTIYPLGGIVFKVPRLCKHNRTRFTIMGRYELHKSLPAEYEDSLKYMIENPLIGESLELNDNRMSLLAGQRGQCYISKQKLNVENMVIRHKKPRNLGGEDKYNNLILINKEMEPLIIKEDKSELNERLKGYLSDVKVLAKVNTLRILVGNPII